MGYPFHLTHFAPTLAQYLRDTFTVIDGNLAGRLYTDEIKVDTKKPVHVLSFGVYLDDLTGYDPIDLGTFTARYVRRESVGKEFTSECSGKEFTSDCAILFEQPVHLVYEKDLRTDSQTEIPFP